MSYKKNKYKIVKNAIPMDVANFVHDYFLMKREVFLRMKKSKYISKYNDDWGKMGDEQCPQSYNHYSDVAMDTILSLLTDKMNKETGLKLSPTYSYARIYNKGESLEKHTDRYSCEVSTTLCLGGDVWPIWLTDTKGKDIEVKFHLPSIDEELELSLSSLLQPKMSMAEKNKNVFFIVFQLVFYQCF